MKKFLIVSIILTALILTTIIAHAENRFKCIYEQDPLGNQAKIIEDTVTGKQYLWYSFGLVEMVDNEITPDWERLVDAIYKAEGGEKSRFAYGIVSVPYKDEAEARQICMNTCKNNWKRFKAQTKHNEYISFLGSRYCPTEGNLSRQEKKLNKNWIPNVLHFYNKEEAK